MTPNTYEKMTTKIQKSSLNIMEEIPGDDLIVILVDKNSDECTVCALPEHGQTTIITSRGGLYKMTRHQEELI